MSREQISAELKKLDESIFHHREEWAGMIGTCWEKADLQNKKERKRELKLMLCRLAALS